MKALAPQIVHASKIVYENPDNEVLLVSIEIDMYSGILTSQFCIHLSVNKE